MATAQRDTRYRLRKARPSPGRPRSVAPGPSGDHNTSNGLPGWNDLDGSNERTRPRSGRPSVLERVSTTRFTLLVAGLALLFTVYIGHVHATQNLLNELQQERSENLRLHLKYNRLKGDFDEMVGPSAIYQRARSLGLIEDPSFGPSIEVDN